MLAADGVLLATYALVSTLFLLISAGASANLLTRSLIGVAAITAVVTAYATRGLWSQRVWAQPLLALRNPTKLALLFVGAGLTLSLQVWRWRSVLHAVGFGRLTTLQSGLTYLLTTLTASPVPVGPGLYKVSPSPVKAVVHALHGAIIHPKTILHTPVALAHNHPLAHTVAAIIILTASALLAACLYAALTFLIYDRPAGTRLLKSIYARRKRK
jgi:hypothetical protein